MQLKLYNFCDQLPVHEFEITWPMLFVYFDDKIGLAMGMELCERDGQKEGE